MNVIRVNGEWCEIIKGKPVKISKKQLARAALHRIAFQFPSFPEGRLMFSCIENAVIDLFNKEERDSAIRFLSGVMPHAEICGVSSQWIYDTLEEMDLFEPIA